MRNREGRAGLVATLLMAVVGVLLGASVAYLGGRGAPAKAHAPVPPKPDLRSAAPAANPVGKARRAELVLSGGAPQRLAAPARADDAPRIIVIFDDMGLDRAAFEAVMALPGPLTLSFLPYGNDLQPMVDEARRRGDAVMLHLPMEPEGEADPGPHSLRANMAPDVFLAALDWNLGRIDGYIGVNNHMGSKLTRNEAAMETVLSVLDARGLFFLDSLTTHESVGRAVGERLGAAVYARDIFLDPGAGRETVRRQLEQVERIARETGYAVAICHPRPDTLAVIGPWLTSAPQRGFALDTVAALGRLDDARTPPVQLALRE